MYILCYDLYFYFVLWVLVKFFETDFDVWTCHSTNFSYSPYLDNSKI